MAVAMESYGTQVEPCYVFRDVFDEAEQERGKTVKDMIKASFRRRKRAIPTPSGSTRWSSWKNGLPATGAALVPKTRELLARLRARRREDWHVASEPERGFYCEDINVTGEHGDHGWHQDGQDYGRLVFVFVAGNTCESVIRVGGKTSKDERIVILYSGDCMVFEGQTWHTVRKCFPKTSPFRDQGAWLHNRRLSVLVRQSQAKSKTRLQRPHFLKK